MSGENYAIQRASEYLRYVQHTDFFVRAAERKRYLRRMPERESLLISLAGKRYCQARSLAALGYFLLEASGR
ncbi:MAG: hypothetical protein KUG75_07585 [Pseudomonadales bacterium]|nr:hypothetical protein [Pseudomonadales bacterium]